MSIAEGTKLGRYEIRSKIGEGGMGEVYRAFDPKINREVAIKVLPAGLSADKDRLARFEQEAQAAGALNHANILAIYDVETHDGAPYVVSELLEGQTLRERMGGVPLSPRKAIEYGLQIAHGLATAHDRGIVHRDLKPENIFITKDGRVKILDFGLAKLTESRHPGIDVDAMNELPTRKVKTDPGTVMGTVGYMSPEQVRGRAVDHRSDIFSFGAILYEMLSARRAFRGQSAADTMSAILREDPPDLSSTNKAINPALERVVNHCLEKNPEERFQSARDLAFALQALSGSAPVSEQTMSAIAALPARSKSLSKGPWIVAGLLALALVATILTGAVYFRRPTGGLAAVRFSVVMPEGVVPYWVVEQHSMNLSPDGRELAFIAVSQGQRQIWLRPLAGLTTQPLAGTEGAATIFWSPDSQNIGFFADGSLKRIDVSGKSLQTICNLPPGNANLTSAAWSSTGTIIFVPEEDGIIYRVPATGGTSSMLFDNKNVESRRWLHFLSDGRHFLFDRHSTTKGVAGIWVGSLDSEEPRELLHVYARSQYANGYLLFAREGSLFAQAFDEKNLRLTGEPIVVVERLPYFDKTGWAEFSASGNGVLVYMTAFPKTRLMWLDRSGREVGQIGGAEHYSEVRLSPDGQKAALRIDDERLISGDLWIEDLSRATPTRFVSGPADDSNPVWSPDGKRLAYFSCCEDPSSLYIKDAADTGKGQLPFKEPDFLVPNAWSPNGQYIIYQKFPRQLWVLPISEGEKPYQLIQTTSSNFGAQFSPDGTWVAFVSDETGRNEVYVTRFDHPAEKWRVSTNGGSAPRWRHDGREIFYRGADSRLMAVEISPGEKFEAGSPVALFKIDPVSPDYDVTSDGQRFLFIASAPGTQSLPYAVVLNWTADLKQ